MRHPIALVAAALVGSTMIAGTAHAQAAAPAGYYVAVPAATPAKPTLITRETLWKLRGQAYVAARAPEREAFLCGAVAHDAGALSSFTVNGRAFGADELASCNSHARGAAAAATVTSAR